MKKKRSNRKKQLLSIQALPIAQIGAIYEEAAAEEEQFRQELAAQSDAYPEGAFAFYEESATVTEGDEDIAVQVVRLGDTSTDASVDLKSVNATAKYGEDFDVYYLDGDEKVYLRQSAEEDTAESADGETSLRSAFAEQTGKETVDTNRRGEYEEYAARVASVEAENEIINAVDGSSVTIPFAAGEYEKKVYVHVNDDDKAESEEKAALILGNATVGMLGTQLEYAVTIQDNEEEEQIVFAMKDSEIVVGEDATYAEITIQRLSGPDYYAGAVYQTVAGTAQPLESYEPVDNGQITFEPGETEKTVQIPLVGEIDAGTYFTVQLSSESNFTQEGQESVVVWLGEKYPGDLSLINPQFPSVSLRSPHPLQHPTFRL